MKTSEQTLSLDTFSLEAKSLIGKAQKFADDNKCRLFDPAHLVAIVLDIPEVVSIFKELSVNTVAFNSKLYAYLNKLPKGDETSSLSLSTIEVLNKAKSFAEKDKRMVGVFDLLLALVHDGQNVAGNIFKAFDINSERIAEHCTPAKNKDREIENCPYLTNLSTSSQKIETIIGRDTEVRRLIQILGRQSKNHPLLVGESGVGKKTIVLALVDRIISQQVPKNFKNAAVIQLETSELLSGAKSRTDVEARMKLVVNTLKDIDAILYVRSIETLLVQGLNLNLHDLFGLMFHSPNLRVITSVSPDGLKKIKEKEANLLKEFTTLTIEPTTPECAVEVLRGVAGRYEKHHNIKIGEKAITTAVKLAKRYIQDRFLPESAIDLLDEAASNKMMEATGMPLELEKAVNRLASIKAQLVGLSDNDDPVSIKAKTILEKEMSNLNCKINAQNSELRVKSRLQPEQEEEAVTLTEESIAMVLGDWTGIPVAKVLGEANKYLKMEEQLSAKVIDQTEAVSAVARSIKRSASGLRNPGKPIGSFMFFGTSGVGKTLLAKSVAELLFDSEDNMIRIDMSEFQEAHTISKLLGSPPGYQGSESGGMLTEAVKKKPYSLILLDEIEKAHQDILNVLLQVLDDGRLTDSKGIVVDFSNTVIILTSNVGSKQILAFDEAAFNTTEGIKSVRETITGEVNKFFRPELLNRIDSQIIFKPLTKSSLYNIVDIEVRKLEKLMTDKELSLKLSGDAKTLLVNLGYNPAFGARPLNRAIMNCISDPLSEFLLKSKFEPGSTIHISVDKNDNFIFN